MHSTPDSPPWYPTEDEIDAICEEVWRDDQGVRQAIVAVELLGDPPVPVAVCRSGMRQTYPPPQNAGWTRIKPGPYLYPEP